MAAEKRDLIEIFRGRLLYVTSRDRILCIQLLVGLHIAATGQQIVRVTDTSGIRTRILDMFLFSLENYHWVHSVATCSHARVRSLHKLSYW